ncbi:glycosyltransferase family 4 protein [Algoriphagus namhaensis]
MHICFLTNEYPKKNLNPGGVGVFLKNLAPSLVKQGHKVTIIGVNNSEKMEDYREDGVRLIRFPHPEVKGLNWLIIARELNAQIRRVHEQSKIDVIEGAELAFAFLFKIPGVKNVIRLHGGHYFFSESENRGINWWKGWQERRSFAKADAIIAVSDYVRTHTAKYHDIESKPIQTIRYPIDLERFAPIDRFDVDPYSMVFIGTICEKKGVRNLIEAFHQVSKIRPEAKLSIYGKDWFYPNGVSYREEMHELVRQLEAQSFISIHDAVPYSQVPAIYAMHEYCIFPSFMETQGLVAPEAMAMEKVVIFTEKGPGPETIEDGVDGYLCNPLSVAHIKQTVLRAFENRAQNITIAKRARESVRRKFGQDRAIQENLDFYTSIIHG